MPRAKFALVMALAVSASCQCNQDPPCVLDFHVLSVSETVDLRIGRSIDNSDCRDDLDLVKGFTWASRDPVVRLEP
jgi:hypothetical protein